MTDPSPESALADVLALIRDNSSHAMAESYYLLYTHGAHFAALAKENADLRFKVWGLEHAHEIGVETIKMRGQFIDALASELREAGCVVDFDAKPIVSNPRAERAEAERDGAVRDAERWRAMRGQFIGVEFLDDGSLAHFMCLIPQHKYRGGNPDAIADAAVDAAMGKGEGK